MILRNWPTPSCFNKRPQAFNDKLIAVSGQAVGGIHVRNNSARGQMRRPWLLGVHLSDSFHMRRPSTATATIAQVWDRATNFIK